MNGSICVLMELNKDYIDSTYALYNLSTNDKVQISKIYEDFKRKLIETKIFTPSQFLIMISIAAKYNNRFLSSYWAIFKKVYEEYHLEIPPTITPLLRCCVCKKYNIDFGQNYMKKFKKLERKKLFDDHSIYKAIMDDNIKEFVSHTSLEGFDEKKVTNCNLFPNYKNGFSYLELCCYYGSENCFKFLRTKFNSEITQKCLNLSFLRGNPYILNECLRYKRPNYECVINAIISHNMDFVAYLKNEHHLEVDIDFCCKYNNLPAFLIHSHQTARIEHCFAHSAQFNIPSICDYYLSQWVVIDSFSSTDKTALIYAAKYNKVKIAEFLISRGANINKKGKHRKTPLEYAQKSNSSEMISFLISHGAEIRR